MKWDAAILQRCVIALATTALLTVSCTPEEQACGPVEVEGLDPLSDQHILPTSSVTFLTDPPTSGPHLSLPAPTGQLDRQLEPALQVTTLEAGAVLIQYRSASDLGSLGELAATDVVVAPNPDLPTNVVFTAWQTKQACSAPDTTTARAFIRDHAGKSSAH